MIDDDFPEIPEFLKLTPEERRAAWADFDRRKKDDPSINVTKPVTGRSGRPAHALPGSGPPHTPDADKGIGAATGSVGLGSSGSASIEPLIGSVEISRRGGRKMITR